MKQLLHPWTPPPPPTHRALLPPLLRSVPFTFPTHKTHIELLLSTVNASSEVTPTTSSTEEEDGELSGRERRRMRNARRESNLGNNWKEEVQDRLLVKPKKKYLPKSAELNLDNLSTFGSRWWILFVSRRNGHETAELVARSLARQFPHMDFKVYAPTVKVRKKLKNGTISEKLRPFVPGSVFLWSPMNKELHDFIRGIYGVRGFNGVKVKYTKRLQILKPKPVADADMEKVFKGEKEEQANLDRAFEEEQKVKAAPDAKKLETGSATKSAKKSKPSTASSDVSDPLAAANSSPQKRGKVVLPTGTTVQILSGKFAGFKGTLKKLTRKTRKATVSITLFGKESMVDLDLEEIVADTE